MRTLLVVFLFSVLSVSGKAQSAKVIALSAPDATTAKSLYEQRAELNKKIEEFETEIRNRYIFTEKTEYSPWAKIHTNVEQQYFVAKPGWGSGGFEFSDDYKFIVPLQEHLNNQPAYIWGNNFVAN